MLPAGLLKAGDPEPARGEADPRQTACDFPSAREPQLGTSGDARRPSYGLHQALGVLTPRGCPACTN